MRINLFGRSTQGGCDGTDKKHAWERCEIHIKFWSENPKGRDRRRWEDNIKMGLEYSVKMWTGFSWLTMGTSGGLL
jgi:hypothetical protein